MLNKSWREKTWSDLKQSWDIIVIGGGITGAGIFNMAAQRKLKVLLLEANDFAFGTSSRSSKLVHGGIRYLRNRQYDVVRESVKERERLLKEANGLVAPLPFIFPSYEDNLNETKMMKLGVMVYDLMAPKWQHYTLNKSQTINALPALNRDGLVEGVKYFDSLVDDSQLVLRVIMDGVRFGGSALNYARVTNFIHSQSGTITGVVVQDETGKFTSSQVELSAKVVINAAGPWTDKLREKIGKTPKLRPLRGSHLIFSREKLPINAAVTMLHPHDNRAMFAIPWENQVIIGTTDLDQTFIEDETRITQSEMDYLITATRHNFPEYSVTEKDIISTFSGLRPIINTNAPTPSKESRAHKIWDENGLVTVAGGKLTIFRVMAADTLNYCSHRLPNQPKFDHRTPCFIHPKPNSIHQETNPDWIMMAGRLGKDVNQFFQESDPENLQPILPMQEFWAELVWACKNEAVIHLDDLLLRRVRLGLLLPNGAMSELKKIQQLVQTPLGWSDEIWQEEVTRYQEIWQKNYSVPK